jgi:hypothetical protein
MEIRVTAKRRMKSPTGKGPQTKGRNFELFVLKKLWEAVGRSWPWKPHERPDGGSHPPQEYFGNYHLEMKRQERLNVHAAVRQAQEGARKGEKEHWAVIFRRSQDAPVVVIDFQDWIQLVTTHGDALRKGGTLL